MIPDQYPNYCKELEIYSGYFDSLDIMILFSSNIVMMRDYCILNLRFVLLNGTCVSVRIFGIMYHHTLFPSLQITRTDISSHIKWIVSLLIARRPLKSFSGYP